MEDPGTCGQGLAATAQLPELIGTLLGALKDVLANHTLAIDLSDANGEQEHDAYMNLVGELGPLAERLQATARLMAGYHDLAAAGHDMQAMADPSGALVFKQFVHAEEALHHWLTTRIEEDRAMLQEIEGA